MDDIRIEMTLPDVQVRKDLLTKLISFNEEAAGKRDHQELSLLVRDGSNRVLGGLDGFTAWGWLYIDVLVIDEQVRGTGLGSKLLAAAENEALSRGCSSAHLYCYEFQNLGFYLKHGYEVFGKLEDFPKGHTRNYLMKQRLAV